MQCRLCIASYHDVCNVMSMRIMICLDDFHVCRKHNGCKCRSKVYDKTICILYEHDGRSMIPQRVSYVNMLLVKWYIALYRQYIAFAKMIVGQ